MNAILSTKHTKNQVDKITLLQLFIVNVLLYTEKIKDAGNTQNCARVWCAWYTALLQQKQINKSDSQVCLESLIMITLP